MRQVYNKYIYLLMRQHNLQQVHILTDASTAYNKYIYFNIVYIKYIYLLMRQHSLHQVHIFTDVST